jgi:hypothetical protein
MEGLAGCSSASTAGLPRRPPFSSLERFTDTYPVRAFVEAATPEDLIVVGSRGLHGPRALGSVSERVAHRAPCSVLVVRPTNWEVPE